jgi:hypothetical protein
MVAVLCMRRPHYRMGPATPDDRVSRHMPSIATPLTTRIQPPRKSSAFLSSFRVMNATWARQWLISMDPNAVRLAKMSVLWCHPRHKEDNRFSLATGPSVWQIPRQSPVSDFSFWSAYNIISSFRTFKAFVFGATHVTLSFFSDCFPRRLHRIRK